MRRKSTRNANKPSPEKPKTESVRKTRSRRKKSTSDEDSEDEVLVSIKAKLDEPPKDQSEEGNAEEIEKADDGVKTRKSRTKDIENPDISRVTRGRSRRSPVVKEETQLEGETSEEEKKGKGKSKSKNKSNIEKSAVIEDEIKPNSEISENAQVTAQSPTIDNLVDNENVAESCLNDRNEAQPERPSEDPQEEQDNSNDTAEDSQSNKEEEAEALENCKTSKASDNDDSQESTDKTLQEQQENTTPINKEKETEPPEEQPERRVEKITIRRSSSGTSHIVKPSIKEKIEAPIKETEEAPIVTATVEPPVETEKPAEEVKPPIVEPEKPVREIIKVMPKTTSKPIKLVRKNSFSQESERKPKRSKWHHSGWLKNISSTMYQLDFESLKLFCPTLQFLDESEVNLEVSHRERHTSEMSEKIERKMSVDNSEDSDRPIDQETQACNDQDTNKNIIAMNRKISIVDDTASKLRPPSPAKNPVSDILFITNLVRPYTAKQLKELLERTGKIKEETFWTDRIKSKCYVQYESIEEAEATRNALHGVNWPIGNGKKLVIDFATEEEMEQAKNPPPVVSVPDKIVEKENEAPTNHEEPNEAEKPREERKKHAEEHIREWDLGKEDFSRRTRSRSRERAHKHRRSRTPEDYVARKQRKTDESVPQKLMDDLFLKTKATPSIYWQPLSPEEIAMKQQQRLVRMEEHKRRMQETARPRGSRDGGRGGNSFRRR